MGADVIKVERPSAGDPGRASPTIVGGQSGYFMQQNMGKRGLCVNLKDKRGLDLMHKLSDEADVFVENYRPGALDKLGLGYEQLSRRNSKLVYCSVSAYGHTGPDAERAGFGLIAEAKSGAMALVGSPGEAPPLFRMPIADMYAGMHGVSAICAALLGRAKSGRGQHIDIALFDCMISMHDFAAQSYLMSGEIPVQTGHDLPQSTVYGSFPAKDGYLVIAARQTTPGSALPSCSAATPTRRTRAFTRRPAAMPTASRSSPPCANGRWRSRRQGLLRCARRRWRAGRAGRAHRRGAGRPANAGTRHGHRAGPPAAGQDQAAQPAVPLLDCEHHLQGAGTAARAAQPRDRLGARLRRGGH